MRLSSKAPRSCRCGRRSRGSCHAKSLPTPNGASPPPYRKTMTYVRESKGSPTATPTPYIYSYSTTPSGQRRRKAHPKRRFPRPRDVSCGAFTWRPFAASGLSTGGPSLPRGCQQANLCGIGAVDRWAVSAAELSTSGTLRLKGCRQAASWHKGTTTS